MSDAILEQALSLGIPWARTELASLCLPKALHFFYASCLHLMEKAYPQALQAAQRAVQHQPSNARFQSHLGQIYKVLNKRARAKTHLQAALHRAPSDAHYWNQLGSLWYLEGRDREAQFYFQQALHYAPTLTAAHFNLAQIALKRDRWQQAAGHYRAVLRAQPEHATAHLNLGLIYLAAKDWPASSHHLAASLVHAPNNADAYFQLGTAYLEQGELARAQAAFASCVALAPQHGPAQHNLAVLYLKAGQKDCARQHFALALELNANNDTARHMLQALDGAQPSAAPKAYVSALFDQYARDYNQHVKQQLGYRVPESLRALIGRSHWSGDHILDLGCGTGLAGLMFRDVARRLVGVDLSQAMLNEARATQIYDALYHQSIEDFLATTDEFFDMVIAADVINYFGALEHLFSQVGKRVKPQGRFLFSIESQTATSGFRLETTGRFSHQAQYVRACAAMACFKVEQEVALSLRTQADQRVQGLAFVLYRPK